MKYRYIVGIDEVGRGPLAGPVSVGAVCINKFFDMSFFAGIRDSKKLSAQKRREWVGKVKKLGRSASGVRKNNSQKLNYSIASVSSSVIDKIGINKAIALAILRALRRLKINPKECMVFLDGGLHAPPEYKKQRTIIRGDEKIAVISLASVIAKQHRDAKMEKYAEKYVGYGFKEHKGYGTFEHLKKIRTLGMCDIHRRSFLKKFFARS